MEFYSEYLKKNIEFTTIQEVDNETGETINIIPHEALISIAKAENFNISQKIMYASQTEVAVMCEICYGSKRVQWIGESNAETLDNEIKRKFRFTMAANQAFDRAMIIFLQLPERRIKSDMEMNTDGNNRPELGPQPVPARQQNPQSAPVRQNTQPVPARQNDGNTGKGVQGQNAGNNGGAPSLEKDENLICTLGKYSKNTNKTLKEIYADDFSWVKWIVESYTPKQEKHVPQYEAIVRYFNYRQQNR